MVHRLIIPLFFAVALCGGSLTLSAQCTTTISLIPTLEGWEQGYGGYVNQQEYWCSDHDFLPASGPSPNAGPPSAYEGTTYLNVPLQSFTPTNCTEQIASLKSPCFDLTGTTNPELRFWYYSQQTNYVALLAQASRDGGQTWEGYYPDPTPLLMSYLILNQPTGWHEVVIDLSAYAGETDFTFRLGVQAAYLVNQDIGFDAFTIAEKPCPSLTVAVATTPATGQQASDGQADLTVGGGTAPYTYQWSNGATTEDLVNVAEGRYLVTVTDQNGCTAEAASYVSVQLACNGTKSGGWPYSYDFENNGLGLLRQNTGDDTNWRRRTGETPTANTGPQSGVSNPAGPQYRYLESSGGGNPGKTAVLTVNKCLNLTSIADPVVQIIYNMYGADQGTLEIQASGDGGQTWSESLWSVSNNQGVIWHVATVDLSTYNTGQTRFRIVGTTGSGPLSDMALDYVYIGSGGGTSFRTATTRENSFFNGLTSKDRDVVTERGPFLPSETRNLEPPGNPTNSMNSSEVAIGPNPARSGDLVNLWLEARQEEQLTIVLRDLSGRRLLVREFKLTSGHQKLSLDLPTISSGLYYLEILRPAGRITRPLVITP